MGVGNGKMQSLEGSAGSSSRIPHESIDPFRSHGEPDGTEQGMLSAL